MLFYEKIILSFWKNLCHAKTDSFRMTKHRYFCKPLIILFYNNFSDLCCIFHLALIGHQQTH